MAAFVLALCLPASATAGGGPGCTYAHAVQHPPTQHPLAFRELLPPPSFGKGGTPDVLPEETLLGAIEAAFALAGVRLEADVPAPVEGATGSLDRWSPEARIGVEVVSAADHWSAETDDGFTASELKQMSDGGQVLVVVPWDERLRALGGDRERIEAEIGRIAVEFVAWARERNRS